MLNAILKTTAETARPKKPVPEPLADGFTYGISFSFRLSLEGNTNDWAIRYVTKALENLEAVKISWGVTEYEAIFLDRLRESERGNGQIPAIKPVMMIGRSEANTREVKLWELHDHVDQGALNDENLQMVGDEVQEGWYNVAHRLQFRNLDDQQVQQELTEHRENHLLPVQAKAERGKRSRARRAH